LERIFTLKCWDNVNELVYQKILWLGLLKINIDEDFDLALETSILKQSWVPKHHNLLGINHISKDPRFLDNTKMCYRCKSHNFFKVCIKERNVKHEEKKAFV